MANLEFIVYLEVGRGRGARRSNECVLGVVLLSWSLYLRQTHKKNGEINSRDSHDS